MLSQGNWSPDHLKHAHAALAANAAAVMTLQNMRAGLIGAPRRDGPDSRDRRQ